jgi:hypothetical protein
MKVQKMISLDIATADIAKELPNFSEFVRQCLHHWAQGDSEINLIARQGLRLQAMERMVDGFVSATGVEVAHMIVEGHRCPLKPEYR